MLFISAFLFLDSKQRLYGKEEPLKHTWFNFLLKFMNIFEGLDKLYFLESLYSHAYLASSKNSNRNYSAEKS